MVAFPPLNMFFSALYYISQEVREGLDNVDRKWTLFAPKAYTKYGYVTGTKHDSRGGYEYSFFRGIPYAAPPVGKLRFEPPKPHPGWTGYRAAKYWGSPCYQVNVIFPNAAPVGSEDCLTINVATRKSFQKSSLRSNGYVPVLVFIHGGFFMVGDSTLYSPRYMMEDDIVFVSMNYRLGSFGFLNTGDGRVSGNMGLKDQAFALKWVKDNIIYFNGDPNRITIFGQSAGGVSVHMHTISPISQGLFAGAISQSGTALSPWAIKQEPGLQAKEFANGLGCLFEDTRRTVSCLKSLPGRTVAAYHKRYIHKEVAGARAIFGPTIDSGRSNVFLPAHPLELLKQGKFSNVPWINGVDSGDGLVFLLPVMRNKTLLLLLNENWNALLAKLMFYEGHAKQKEISDHLRKNVLNDYYLSRNNLAEAGRMLSHRLFFHDSHKAALLHSKNAPVYLYYYNNAGLFSGAALAFEDAATLAINWAKATLFNIPPPNNFGICHGDEVPLLFNVPVIRKRIDYFDPDVDTSRRLVRLWTSFAYYGRPSLQAAGISDQWPSVKESNPGLENKPLKMLQIEKRSYPIIDEPYFEGILYWQDLGFHD